MNDTKECLIETADKSTCTREDSFENLFHIVFSYSKELHKQSLENKCDFMYCLNKDNQSVCIFPRGLYPRDFSYTHIANTRLFFSIHESLPKDLKEALDKKQIEARHISSEYKTIFIVIVMGDLNGNYENRVFKLK